MKTNNLTSLLKFKSFLILLLLFSCNNDSTFYEKIPQKSSELSCGFDCNYSDIKLMKNLSISSKNHTIPKSTRQVPVSLNVIRTD